MLLTSTLASKLYKILLAKCTPTKSNVGMTLAKAEQTVCTLCVVNDFLFTQDRLSLKSERDMIPLLKQAIEGVEQARKCHLICVDTHPAQRRPEFQLSNVGSIGRTRCFD